MKARLRQIGIAASMAAIVLGSTAGAQTAPAAQGKQASPAPAQAPSIVPMVWTGKMKAADGTLREVPLAGNTTVALRKELASITVALEVDRDFTSALSKLADLCVRASRPDCPERIDLLIDIAEARSKALLKLGRVGASRQAASTIFPTVYTSEYVMTPAGAADLKAMSEAGLDERLLHLNMTETSAVSTAQDSPADTIDEIVRDAIERGDSSVIGDLGARAVPALERMVLDSLDALPEYSKDPLRHLTDIDKRSAAELMLAHFDDSGPIWKTRILRTVNRGQIYTNSTGWLRDIQGDTPTDMQWPALLGRLIGEPSTQAEALPLIGQGLRVDALTPGLVQQLAGLIVGPDAAPAQALGSWLSVGAGNASLLPVAEAGLRSKLAPVRASAAAQLQHWPESPALLAAFEHEDPVIRAAAAATLRPRSIRTHMGWGNYSFKEFTPVIGERERSILAKLLADPNADVRLEAARSSIALMPAPGDLYPRLAADSDARVRLVLLNAKDAPISLRAQVAVAVAASQDADTLARFDEFMSQFLKDGPSDEALLQLLPAIRARQLNPSSAPSYLNGLYELLSRSPAGLEALVQMAAVKPDTYLRNQVQRRFKDRVHSSTQGREFGFVRMNIQPAEVGILATPTELAALYQEFVRWNAAEATRLTWQLVCLDFDLSAPFLKLAQDKSTPSPLRLGALDVASNFPNEKTGNLLLELMAGESGATLVGEQCFAQVASIASRLSGPEGRRCLDAVLADERLPDLLANYFAWGFATSNPMDAATADRVLTRWLTTDSTLVVGLALKQVASRRPEAQGDWLERAVRESGWGTTAIDLISDMRDPRFLPLLKEGLSGERSFGNPRLDVKSTRTAILNALTRFFNDEAADIILATAGSTGSSELRADCFKALETIRKYQEEKGRWQSDRASRAATDAAIRDLLTLLDDPTPVVRAQAVRGLATLHAIEQMPRIVRMLKDVDEGVRKAAGEALGVLNQPPDKQQ